MNPQETQKIAARDEKWVPFIERVKISSTNFRLEATVPQKEEIFQVVIDLIKNSKCFKAFTVSADVLEIFMQQFWYFIKKVQSTDSYKFLLANKKCVVNVDVFRTILDICPRVEGVTSLMYQMMILHLFFSLSWDTKGMFYRENVDYPKLIWEDLAYQIDHMKEKRSRCENIPFPRFTKEYGLSIPGTMLTEAIKQSESYQMFIKYSTTQIPPKKSRGKESKHEPEPIKRKTSSKKRVKKKVTLSADDNIISDDPDTALELGKPIRKTKAEEAKVARKVHATHARIVTEYVPEPTRRRKSGKVTSDPPKKLKGVPFLTREEQEAANIMQALKESKKTSKRQPCTGGSDEGIGTLPGVPNESTVVSSTSSEGTGTKLGVPDEEKDITKENVILEWGSEQESEYSEEDKLDNEEKDDKEGDVDDEDDEIESYEDDIYKYKIRDEEVTDATKADAEKTSEVKDDAKKTKLPPRSSSLSVSSGFGDQFLKLSFDSSLVSTIKDTTDAEINSLLEVKIQSEVPHIQSPSMFKVLVFVISKPLVLTLVQESPSIATVTTLPPPSVSTTPHLRVAKLEKDLFELKKIDLSAKALATLKTQVPSVIDNYLGSKVGDVFKKELKKYTVDLIQKYSLQQIPELPKKQTSTVDLEQESKKTPSKILKIKKEQAEKQKMPKFTIKSTDKVALKECDHKSALYQTMNANKSFNRNPAIHRLYHSLIEALIEDENAMDKGVADTIQDHKRKHDDEDDDDEDPPAGPNQGKKTKRRRTKESDSSKKPSTTKVTPKGKAPSKGSKTDKSASAKEPVEEPIVEVVMDDAGDDVANGDDQPQNASEPKTTKTPNPNWFTQPPRPPTHDPEWNKRQYLKSSDPERTYTTSITKTKAAQYEIEGIEDMVPTLWSPTKVGYEKDALKGIKHWGEGRKLWHKSQLNKFSKHNVYCTKKILGVKSVSVKKLYRYGHLEEIVVKRVGRQNYKFKEGDFVDLHMNDIEDMLLVTVQHKLFHLTDSDITVPEIEFKELYTPSHKPPGVIYEDLTKQKRVMRADELYKFSGGTLKKVRDELHHKIRNFHLEYNTDMPKRKWKAINKIRSKLMVELIDKQMRERRIIRNLERLVGARELEMDYKLMMRTT
ncbi:hypothetical protein Tco_1485712 [Tanacetum coccineum]